MKTPVRAVSLLKMGSEQDTSRMASSGMLRRVALVRTDVSDELIASIIRVTRIGEIGKTLAVTSNLLVLCVLHGLSISRYKPPHYEDYLCTIPSQRQLRSRTGH
jgi:hypothetical protein